MSEPNDHSPICTVIALCEKVLSENGIYSLIRIIDGIQIELPPPNTPIPFGIAAIKLSIFLSLRAGPAIGKRQFRLTLSGPDGEIAAEIEQELDFDNPERAFNYTNEISLMPFETGTCWLSVFSSGTLLTKTPISIRHITQAPEGGPSGTPTDVT